MGRIYIFLKCLNGDLGVPYYIHYPVGRRLLLVCCGLKTRHPAEQRQRPVSTANVCAAACQLHSAAATVHSLKRPPPHPLPAVAAQQCGVMAALAARLWGVVAASVARRRHGHFPTRNCAIKIPSLICQLRYGSSALKTFEVGSSMAACSTGFLFLLHCRGPFLL